jgi:hypothetical protein
MNRLMPVRWRAFDRAILVVMGFTRGNTISLSTPQSSIDQRDTQLVIMAELEGLLVLHFC